MQELTAEAVAGVIEINPRIIAPITAELAAEAAKHEFDATKAETDMSRLSEGLYIKVEENGLVRERLKFVRYNFVQQLLDSGSHWMERPIVENQLAPGVDIWAA